jgi:hypothetical protein
LRIIALILISRINDTTHPEWPVYYCIISEYLIVFSIYAIKQMSIQWIIVELLDICEYTMLVIIDWPDHIELLRGNYDYL